MAGTLPGFDADAFRDAIHTVQEFFIPADYRPLFVFPDVVPTGPGIDAEHVPFNPASTPVRTPTKPPVHVPCSIEYDDANGRLENLGTVVPGEIIVGLLDEDYELVKGFYYVVINDTRYYYQSTDVPGALGTVTVWSIRCLAEDQT